MFRKGQRTTFYLQAFETAWQTLPFLTAIGVAFGIFLLDKFFWLDWLLGFFVERPVKSVTPVVDFKYFIIAALALISFRLFHALAKEIKKSSFGPLQLKKKRKEMIDALQSVLTPNNNGTFGRILVVDSEDENYPDTVGRERIKNKPVNGTIFGFSDYKYLEVWLGQTPATRDVSTGKWIIGEGLHVRSEDLLRIGLIPLEWIDEYEIIKGANLCRIFCRFEGVKGPFAKIELYKTSRRPDGSIHKESIIDYYAAIKNSYSLWDRVMKGIGNKIMP